MKLIILGAGASFDSIYEYYDDINEMEWRPPLANEIFSPRRNFRDIILSYPGGRYFMSQLNGISDIEEFFEKQWEIIENNRADDLMAAFINLNYCLSHLMYRISYAHHDTGLSNYDVLVQKAYEYSVKYDEEVMFVTFNYDILLEFSISKVYYGHSRQLEIAEYLNKPLKIIKPHGSCNWFKKLNVRYQVKRDENIHNQIYHSRLTIKKLNELLDKEFKILSTPLNFSVQQQLSTTIEYYFPQLLIPLKEKDDFILPKSHDEYLKNNLKKVNEILIIGWKGTENRFLELLQQNIGAKKINITCVNAGNTDIWKALTPILPNATAINFSERIHLTRIDNTNLSTKDDEKTYHIQPTAGSFSAYIISLMQNKHKSIFETK